MPVELRFDELGLELKSSGKRVLDGVTGTFAHSSLNAIMGPSGCGKTSFLNALTGKAHYGDTTGALSVNGVQRTIQSMRRVVGFVPQADTVHTDLTVRREP